MTRKLLFILFPLLLLTFVSSAHAETVTTNSATTTTTNSATTNNAQPVNDAATKLKQQRLLIQEQKKADVTRAKDEAKVKIQAAREEFKTRLQTIKDRKKRTLVERIDIKLAEINKKHTSRFTDALVRIQNFLDKLSQSATDPNVLADISAAQTAIDTAKAAVEEQTVKAYTMEVIDDATLRLNAGTVVSQLRQDLIAVHKLTVEAKQLVQKLNASKEPIRREATDSAK